VYKIKTLNKISPTGLDRFGEDYNLDDENKEPDAIVLRSFKMHDYEFGNNLKAIARAGAGVNNIPLDVCSEKGIVVFNTPGANANAVKELVVASLFLTSRDITSGVGWVQSIKDSDDVVSLVEKNKSNFAGCEIKGKTLGVIGLGAIGAMVANSALDLGMRVKGYDPYLSVDGAWLLSNRVKKTTSLDKIFEKSDYITIHVPLLESTKNMIDKDSLRKCKDGVKIINFSRGGLVNNEDIIKAIEDKKVSSYITDFPQKELLGIKGIIPVPHLGASTQESEENCAIMAVDEIKEFLENGNIVNSVNFPNASMPRSPIGKRLVIANKNIPRMIESITSILANNDINILNMLNRSRGDIAYNIININGNIEDQLADEIEKIDEVIFARLIK